MILVSSIKTVFCARENPAEWPLDQGSQLVSELFESKKTSTNWPKYAYCNQDSTNQESTSLLTHELPEKEPGGGWSTYYMYY